METKLYIVLCALMSINLDSAAVLATHSNSSSSAIPESNGTVTVEDLASVTTAVQPLSPASAPVNQSTEDNGGKATAMDLADIPTSAASSLGLTEKPPSGTTPPDLDAPAATTQIPSGTTETTTIPATPTVKEHPADPTAAHAASTTAAQPVATTTHKTHTTVTHTVPPTASHTAHVATPESTPAHTSQPHTPSPRTSQTSLSTHVSTHQSKTDPATADPLPKAPPTGLPNTPAGTHHGLFPGSSAPEDVAHSEAPSTAIPQTAETPVPQPKTPSPTQHESTSSSASAQAKAHVDTPSQLNVGGDTTVVHETPALDPLLAGLVSAFIITAVIITLLLFLKLRRRDNRPEFHRLQDLPMDDMMEDTPLSMYSY